MGSPHNWFWNPTAQRWEIRGGPSEQVTAYVSEDQFGIPQNLLVNQVATIGRNANVGSLLTAQGFVVPLVGSLR